MVQVASSSRDGTQVADRGARILDNVGDTGARDADDPVFDAAHEESGPPYRTYPARITFARMAPRDIQRVIRYRHPADPPVRA